MKKLLTVFVFSFFSYGSSFTDSIESIDIAFKSYHSYDFKRPDGTTSTYQLNENNPGLFLNFNNGVSVGYVRKNSFNRESYIISYSFDGYRKGEFISVYPIVGVSTGYDFKFYHDENNNGFGDENEKVEIPYVREFLGGYLPISGVVVKVGGAKVFIAPNVDSFKDYVAYFGYSFTLD